jgi:hypothetical protein
VPQPLGDVRDDPCAGGHADEGVDGLAQSLDDVGDLLAVERLVALTVAGMDVDQFGARRHGGDRIGGQVGRGDGAAGVGLTVASTVQAGLEQHSFMLHPAVV